MKSQISLSFNAHTHTHTQRTCTHFWHIVLVLSSDKSPPSFLRKFIHSQYIPWTQIGSIENTPPLRSRNIKVAFAAFLIFHDFHETIFQHLLRYFNDQRGRLNITDVTLYEGRDIH